MSNVSVSDLLRSAADIYEERNAEYGDTYKNHGNIVKSLFPEGIELKDESDMRRFAILDMVISKLGRYCNNFTTGGHQDSLHDISVYVMMLDELDQEDFEWVGE